MSIVLKIVAVILWLVTIADLPRLLAALRSGSPAYIAGTVVGMLLLTLLGYAIYRAALRMDEKAKAAKRLG